MEDQPLRFRMLANGGFHPILSPETARRLHLRYRAPISTIASGATRTGVRISDVAFDVDGRAASNYAFWSGHPIAPEDGTLGPYSVPQRVVTFRLRSPAPGERTFVLPLTNLHDDAVEENDPGMGTFIKVGGVRVFVQWDLTRNDTLANAPVTAGLTEHHGGEVRGTPVGARAGGAIGHMRLAEPLLIGPLRFEHLSAWHNADISRHDPVAEDARAIVVTGRRRGDVLPTLLIGREAMRRCSSLTFDRSKGRIVLSCVPA